MEMDIGDGMMGGCGGSGRIRTAQLPWIDVGELGGTISRARPNHPSGHPRHPRGAFALAPTKIRTNSAGGHSRARKISLIFALRQSNEIDENLTYL